MKAQELVCPCHPHGKPTLKFQLLVVWGLTQWMGSLSESFCLSKSRSENKIKMESHDGKPGFTKVVLQPRRQVEENIFQAESSIKNYITLDRASPVRLSLLVG